MSEPLIEGVSSGADTQSQMAGDPRLAAMSPEVLHTVLSLVIKHQLSHRYDSGDLDVAIELLKAVRDEGPEQLAILYERWAEEIASAYIPPSAPPALDVERLRPFLLHRVTVAIVDGLAEYARLQEQDR